MTFPDFNENGDLPVGIYKATLREVLEHFGKGSFQRQLVAGRLAKIYNLAKSTISFHVLSSMALLLQRSRIRMTRIFF